MMTRLLLVIGWVIVLWWGAAPAVAAELIEGVATEVACPMTKIADGLDFTTGTVRVKIQRASDSLCLDGANAWATCGTDPTATYRAKNQWTRTVTFPAAATTEVRVMCYEDASPITAYTQSWVQSVYDEDRLTSTDNLGVKTGGIVAASFAAGAIDSAAIATDAITSSKIATNAIGVSEIEAGAITSSEAPNLDAAMTSRMATYTQPTGFLAATFPTGTLANTTNIAGGTITTVTNLTNHLDTSGTTTLLTRIPQTITPISIWNELETASTVANSMGMKLRTMRR